MVGVMKTQTIWESASRPLFVRSVWLEATHDGRGAQRRHFILDYQPEDLKRKRKAMRSAFSPERDCRKKETLNHSASLDFSELSSSVESQEVADNFFLLGSAKIKLQQQPIQQKNTQQLKLLKFYRRPSFTKTSKQTATLEKTNYQYQVNRRMRELQDLYSKNSSSLDIQSTLSNACSNPEERLAERVLNWLDLAGKSGMMKSDNDPTDDVDLIEDLKYPYYDRHQQQQAQTYKRQNYKEEPTQHTVATNRPKRKSTGNSKYSTIRSTHSVHQHHSRRSQPDSVKPITIIFNRDGFPVRFNRPARNIDLCSLASNAVTTRRLAGTLASARLYKGNEMAPYKPRSVKADTSRSSAKPPSTSRTINTARVKSEIAEKPPIQSSQKRSHDDMVVHPLQDSKRQLHIFMPSLPKKGLISPSMLSSTHGADDSSVSVLSRCFNESCKL